jgi:hypothetical protein
MPNRFRTLRADAKGVKATDGLYDETQEPFGAFFIIEADDMDEAVRVARLHPGTLLGSMMKGASSCVPSRHLNSSSSCQSNERLTTACSGRHHAPPLMLSVSLHKGR